MKSVLKKTVQYEDSPVSLQEIATADGIMTSFLTESTKTFLSLLPKSHRRIDAIILIKFPLWQDQIPLADKRTHWDVVLGDAHHLARTFNTPVLTDFIRQYSSDTPWRTLPTGYGYHSIGRKVSEITVFVNIGRIAEMILCYQKQKQRVLISDTGPGTYLIDPAAKEAGCNDGFDRDGSAASSGALNTEVLEQLLKDDWFTHPAPKQGSLSHFIRLYYSDYVQVLTPKERLTTMTAFTALAINNFYKRVFSKTSKPDTIRVAGGGANNQAPVNYLQAYFAPLPVKTVEHIGIPCDCLVPLSLGLTVQGLLNGQDIFMGGKKSEEHRHLGNWVFP